MPARPRTPRGLSWRAGNLWRQTVDEFEFSAPELILLEEALRALDRAEQARQVVNEQGITTTDRFGQIKDHPAARVERDCRAQAATILRQLGVHEVPAA